MGLPGKPNGCHAAGLLFGCLGTIPLRSGRDEAQIYFVYNFNVIGGGLIGKYICTG